MERYEAFESLRSGFFASNQEFWTDSQYDEQDMEWKEIVRVFEFEDLEARHREELEASVSKNYPLHANCHTEDRSTRPNSA